MAVSLSKGQAIDLGKVKPGLQKITMGLGWDAAKPKSLLGKMFSRKPDAIDLDASCIVLNAGRKALDIVWFRQLEGLQGAIRHSGDNLTGDGDGDDESISLDLTRLPEEATTLAFTVNSFRGQTFDEVENAYCRLVDGTDGKEICRYDLAGRGRHTGVVMAVVVKVRGAWTLRAVGEPANGRTAADMVDACARHAG